MPGFFIFNYFLLNVYIFLNAPLIFSMEYAVLSISQKEYGKGRRLLWFI
jgi:hypothetical protein